MNRWLIFIVLFVGFYGCFDSVDHKSVDSNKIVGKWCSIVDGAEDFWIQFNIDSSSTCGKGDGSVRNGKWFLYDKDSIYFTIENSVYDYSTGKRYVMNEVYRSNYEFADNNTITIKMQLYKWGHIKNGRYTMHAVRCE